MICRLCLKDIPKESSIKLYENLNLTSESIEMVKLIDKYLKIEVSNLGRKNGDFLIDELNFYLSRLNITTLYLL